MNKKICQDDLEIHGQTTVFQKNLTQTLGTIGF